MSNFINTNCRLLSFDALQPTPSGGQSRGPARLKVVRLFAALAGLTAGLGCLGELNTVGAEASQANWPQWRGPLGTGVAPEANPPVQWSETEHIKWKVKIPGSGSATPIVWGNRIFIQTAIPTGKKSQPAAQGTPTPPPQPPPPASPNPGPGLSERRPSGRGGMNISKPTEAYQFVILCLDRQIGTVLWQQVAREEVPHEGFKAGDGSFASASPVTDGESVFAYFGSRGLHAYSVEGKPLWNQDLGRMRIVMGFGEGSSPVLYHDTLVVNWDHEGDSFITALDKKTGKTLWKNTRPERTSWATPLVVEQDGKPQVIVSASGRVRCYDLANGNLIWECGGLTRNVIPTPVAGNGNVYAMSGFQGTALLAIRLGREGDLTGTDAIAWSYGKNTPYVPSPLLAGNRLYFFSNNREILSCFDAKNGKPLIDAQKIEGLQGVYASPVSAQGRVYLVGRNGVTVVIKQSDQLEVLATNRLDEGFDASPVPVGRELLLRGHEYLYCIAE